MPRQHREHRRSHPAHPNLSEDICTITTKLVTLENQLFDIQSILVINITDALIKIKAKLSPDHDSSEEDDPDYVEESESEYSSDTRRLACPAVLRETVASDTRRPACPAVLRETVAPPPDTRRLACPTVLRETVAPPPGLRPPELRESETNCSIGLNYREKAYGIKNLSVGHQSSNSTRTEPGAQQTPAESPAEAPEASASLAPPKEPPG